MADETPIERTAVKSASSNIKGFGYCSERSCLDVEFSNGGIYRYDGVSPDEYAALVKADETDGVSVGKHINRYIKPKKFAKV